MYLIQFRLQFFVLIFTFYTRIKAMRLQAWANAGGGGKSKPSPPPPPRKKVLWLYWGPFCYFFFIWGPFCYVFGGLFTMWEPFCYFLLHGGGLFGGVPRPLRKFLRAPMIARRVREHAPRKFFV